ncbi:MAG TPA: hypothetical protein DEA44_00855 [Firmicutes bacterium]|nr:hypothetical protein [Bacillota bacterium]
MTATYVIGEIIMPSLIQGLVFSLAWYFIGFRFAKPGIPKSLRKRSSLIIAGVVFFMWIIDGIGKFYFGSPVMLLFFVFLAIIGLLLLHIFKGRQLPVKGYSFECVTSV